METITLTFGDAGENHKGMQMIGQLATEGISVAHLEKLHKKLGGELIDLNELVVGESEEGECEEAAILVLRGGIDLLLSKFCWESDDLMDEQKSLQWDSKVFMYGRVVNKHARHNLCFDEKSQEPDYENKKGRIVAFDELPITQALKMEIMAMLNVKALIAEGNYYYDVEKCGIGFHGDSERKIVVGCRLGASMDLHYQWYLKSERLGKRHVLTLNHGDLYIMSSKAVGFDWKKRNVPTLRHAAGCEKFTK